MLYFENNQLLASAYLVDSGSVRIVLVIVVRIRNLVGWVGSGQEKWARGQHWSEYVFI